MLLFMGEWLAKFLVKVFGSRNQRLLNEMLPAVDAINALEPEIARLSDRELRQKTDEFRRRLKEHVEREGYHRLLDQARKLKIDGFREESVELRKRAARLEQKGLDALLPEAFACAREAGKRTLGMRHFDVQLMGGMALHQGKIAEMVTGEGKTLVATLPAYLNAIAGHGVNVVTVNDYLARRDRDWNAPIYELLGLTVGVIQHDQPDRARQEAYACDITYGTNNEFGFDYLRDNMKTSLDRQVQGHLFYAIIDEVDSILVDEARTPLIISGASEESTSKYYVADRVAKQLKQGDHFEVKEKEHLIILSDEGQEAAERLVGVDSFYSGANMDWPHHIDQALRAHHLYKRDRDYVCKEGEVIIVDEFTGRLMPGRVWSDGLHQAVSAKEGLKIKEENQTLATVTIQNYFRLYTKIAGMTGTAQTEAEEFMKIYGLDIVTIPTNRPLIRDNWHDVVYRSEREKFKAICDEIERLHILGRPQLVGTIAIEKSEFLSEMLSRRGIQHEVLNAKQHEREAPIVAKAGQLRNVTVATNMAGRGTDILLGPAPKDGDAEGLAAAVDWVASVFGGRGRKLRAEDLEGAPAADVREKLLAFAREGLAERAAEWSRETGVQAAVDDLLGAARDGGDPRDLLDKPLKQKGVKDEFERFRKADALVRYVEAAVNVERYFEGGVARMGGLHVLGTERHEARRIDNQLRGRCGRQGDPGSSQFFLALEDDLMRIFAPERVGRILERLGMTEGQEISHPMVSRAIERAQKKVEARNFDIRKNLLEYDQVMDEQRKLVYEYRQRILTGSDTKGLVAEFLRSSVRGAIEAFASDEIVKAERNYQGLADWVKSRLDVEAKVEDLSGRTAEELDDKLFAIAEKKQQDREKEIGEKPMRELERFLLLQKIDEKWKDHLHGMDQLRSGIGLRGYAQVDPKIAYKKEGFELFEQMWGSVQDEVTSLLFKVRLITPEEEAKLLGSVWRGAAPQISSAPGGQASRPVAAAAAAGDGGNGEQGAPDAARQVAATARRQEADRRSAAAAGRGPMKPIHVAPKTGRNDPCPCGSGKKFKKCCGQGQGT